MSCGERGTPPAQILPGLGDELGGMVCAWAVCAALYGREKTGKGQLVDLCQAQTVGVCLGEAYMDYTMNGRVQETMGNRHPSAIQGVYRCADGGLDDYVVITIYDDEQWEGFCRAIGNPPWTKEAEFADALSRCKNHDELDSHIEEWTSQRNKYDVMHLLQKEGVPSGPLMNERDVYNDPHVPGYSVGGDVF